MLGPCGRLNERENDIYILIVIIVVIIINYYNVMAEETATE